MMWLIIFDVAPVAILYFTSKWLYYNVDPYERGFFCNDETIRHPYRESTVSYELYQCVCYGGALILTSLVEFLMLLKNHNGKSSKVTRYLSCLYTVLLAFMFGTAINELLTTISKLSAGRLRPHFVEVCNPNFNFTTENCGTWLNPNYITDFECLGSSQFESNEEKIIRIQDARKSFLSGHSSTTVYSMLFLVLYLQFRLKDSLFTVLRSFLQVGCLVFAFFTCISRISDYKHHPEDVITGVLLGIAEACFAIFWIIPKEFFKDHKDIKKKTECAYESIDEDEVNIYEKEDYQTLQ